MAGTRIWEEERKFMISVGSMECNQFRLKTCFGVRFGFCGLLWAYVGIRMGCNSNLNRDIGKNTTRLKENTILFPKFISFTSF